MKIALVSMNIKAGQCVENVAYMKEQIKLAIIEKADLIVFPQNAISGYLMGDAWLDPNWCKDVDRYNEELIALSDDVAIVWGNIRYRHKQCFNCAFFAYQGKTSMRVKANRNGGIQCDSRYFQESQMNHPIEFMGNTIALNFGDERQVVDYNINLDARSYVQNECFIPKGNMIYVNALGIQNQGKNVMIYDGVTGVSHNGKLLHYGTPFKEVTYYIDAQQQKDVSILKNSLLDAMIYAIQQFDMQTFQGRMPWIIGLSGGLDSSVSAALLCMALGSDRVIAYNMASKHNSDTTKNNASFLSKQLGMKLCNGSIEKLMNTSIEVLKDYGYDDEEWNPLVKENIQARIRGHLLSTFASIHGGIIANNGNKVEVALGYCTLYGDAIGALCLIGDLSKVDLFMLSEEINQSYGKEVIPQSLLPEVQGDSIHWIAPPSAELADHQFDPMKWFYHDEILSHLRIDMSLESYMEQYLVDKCESLSIYKWIKYYGLEDPIKFMEDMDWLKNTIKRNAFKRIQLPPLLVVSKNPYGNSFHESQMNMDMKQYELLKDKILKM